MSTPDFDYSILKKAFELYAEERYYSEEALEAERQVTFSPEFEARMQKLIRRQKNPYYLVFNTVGKRVAAVTITILVALTVTTFSVKAFREPFVRFITEMFEKFTSIVFVKDEEDTPRDTLATFEKQEPQYIPEGYAVDSVMETSISYEVRYTKDGFDPIRYKQEQNLNTEANVDTQNTDYTKVDIGKYEGVLYTNKDTINLYFCDKKCRYLLIVPTSLGENEVVRIAESIAKTL